MPTVEHVNATPAPAGAATAPPGKVSSSMQAILHRHYGPPDVLTLATIARPLPGVADVLIRVHAACVTIGDHHVVTGKPYLIRLSAFGGLPHPKNRVLGALMAGRVEAVGANVTAFRAGDDVFGQATAGAFAEYLAMPAKMLAAKPSSVSFEEAAAIPWGATALQGLRDAGGLKAGQKVLINGAAGGVGSWAVQIAKALGAEVTAVCSTRNVERMRALGADHVLDYTAEDFAAGGARFDVMLDLVGNRPLSECRRVLVRGGTYVPCAGGEGVWIGPLARLAGGLLSFLFSGRKFKTFVMTPKQDDLLFLKALVEEGKARPVIERRYPLSEVAEALRQVGQGHAQGQTVISIGGETR